ncbi:hypothetical protein HYC85_001020 [Camellia sinensis]|uniref:Expansin-like EG45 domain-containing protein n=1 Tax=Camellia sinensis TaxID=4442 RepID=A0A7J7I5E7_CAMSI|nr:hypothetical protein HYC85_001020 [Camellia sinensis]
MATTSYHSSLSRLFVSRLVAFLCFSKLCLCLMPKQLNLTTSLAMHMQWSTAGATWYGHPNGAGIDGGGRCGYGDLVLKPPFSSLTVSLRNPFHSIPSRGCGACLQVKCTSNPLCSGKSVRVVVTDHHNPEGPSMSTTSHFHIRPPLAKALHSDFWLSGTAFGALANPGEEDQLRSSKLLQIQYSRVPCDYSGTTIALRVLPGSIHNKLGLAIQSPKSDIVRIDLKEASRGSDESSEWKPMQKLLGGVWQFVSGSALQAPISIRLRSSNSSRTMVADAVIPGGWQPGSTYRSLATSESHLV